jgi:hypothetical protein
MKARSQRQGKACGKRFNAKAPGHKGAKMGIAVLMRLPCPIAENARAASPWFLADRFTHSSLHLPHTQERTVRMRLGNLPKSVFRLLLLAGMAVVAILPQAFAGGSRTMPPMSARTNVTYAADVRPILEVNCFACHGPRVQKRQLRLDTLEFVGKGCEDGPVIFPGKSDEGDLILEICGLGDHDMPPYPYGPPLLSREHYTNAPPSAGPDGGPVPKALTAEQIGLVRAWVAQGAK